MKHAALLVLLAILQADLALACTVCGFSGEASKWAFIATTGILTFVPLIFIGSVVYFFIYQNKKINE